MTRPLARIFGRGGSSKTICMKTEIFYRTALTYIWSDFAECKRFTDYNQLDMEYKRELLVNFQGNQCLPMLALEQVSGAASVRLAQTNCWRF